MGYLGAQPAGEMPQYLGAQPGGEPPFSARPIVYGDTNAQQVAPDQSSEHEALYQKTIQEQAQAEKAQKEEQGRAQNELEQKQKQPIQAQQHDDEEKIAAHKHDDERIAAAQGNQDGPEISTGTGHDPEPTEEASMDI